MLTALDDYPIHPLPRPIAEPGTTDRNAYGRYWFGAAHRRGDFQIEAAFGRYPNLGVVDASVSISTGGAQHSFHASGLAPADPTATAIGPYRLEIVEPMKVLRIVVDDNDTGITAELEWRARTGAFQEDHTVMDDGYRTIIDMIRFVQFGSWEGTVTVDGRTTEAVRADTIGIRDRSWGVRPVGERPNERPGSMPPNAWFWAPVHFPDDCRLIGYFQRPGGEMWRPGGHVIPVVDPVPVAVAHDAPGVVRLEPVDQRLEFRSGSRQVTAAAFDVVDDQGRVTVLELEPLHRFDMRGLGYANPTWGHGHWKGELAVGSESWNFDEVDALDPFHQHQHHVVRARMGDLEGVGIFEQILYGPHTQYGFHDLLDGAP